MGTHASVLVVDQRTQRARYGHRPDRRSGGRRQ